jgi:branched-chain amino acid transport system ATP-binding protein
MLETRALTARYKSADVLHDIDIRVETGEIVAILGANGAGKSTLLRALVGLLHPRQGSVWFDGQQIDSESPEAILGRGMALVPEGRRIFVGLTVLENLRMGAYTERRKEVVEERFAAVYERFPMLAERRRQMGETLSGGEQQQLAIARALMSEPRMLLLDEPSLGLAPHLVHMVMALLRDLREDGLTVLLVEQDIHEALALADRAYVMASGRIEVEGTATKLRGLGLELERSYLGEDR